MWEKANYYLPRSKSIVTWFLIFYIQKNKFKTIREIANETSFNEEHTRRTCKNLFLEKEIYRKNFYPNGVDIYGYMSLRLLLNKVSNKIV